MGRAAPAGTRVEDRAGMPSTSPVTPRRILLALAVVSVVSVGPIACSAWSSRDDTPFRLDPETQRILDHAENPPYNPAKNALPPTRANAAATAAVTSPTRTGMSPDAVRRMDRTVQESVETGTIQRVDVQAHKVLVNSLVWAIWNADAKEAFTTTLAYYCAQHVGSDLHYVDVIDGQSGRKLAHYGVWGFEVF
jgi:hypothetical protein